MGTLMIPAVDSDPQSTAQFMSATGVEYVSATPSYWRRLLMFADPDLLATIPIVQITLGGEVVDQPVLDRLRRLFPKARLVHLYATTEMGRCFSVSDGLAGFPESYLDGPQPDGVELRVENSELMIRSANSMRMYDPYCSHPEVADWFATGDIVEIKASRVYFAGRKSDMINVAGSKVYPIEVERVIRAVPGVSDVRVFGRASSIAGELVACEIVPDPDQDTKVLQSLVARTCRDRLSSPQQPRLMKFVSRIDLSAAGKTLRARA
jgi:acyl-CoA synthetase (AMP-forming)/AMP-acid ligase II